MRRIPALLLLTISLLLVPACKQPNIYSALGLYSPVDDNLGEVETVAVKAGSFNLLSLSSRPQRLVINYTLQKDSVLLKELDGSDMTRLIQSIDYLYRHGDLEAFLSMKLDDATKEATKDTKALAQAIIAVIESFVMDIVGALAKVGGINAGAFQDFFDFFEEMVGSNQAETVVDYLAIQLTLDLLSSCFELVSIVFLDLVPDAASFTWDEFKNKGNGLTPEQLLSAASENIVSMTGCLLDGVSNADLVSSRIPGFASLSTIVDGLL